MDVRFLPNPHWVPELRAADRPGPDVRDYVLRQPGAEEFLDTLSPVAPAGRRRLPPGGQAVSDRRDRLHRRQAPQRGDRGGTGRRRLPSRGQADSPGGAPGSGARVTDSRSQRAARGGRARRRTRLVRDAAAARQLTAGCHRRRDRRRRRRLVRPPAHASWCLPPGDLRMALVALAIRQPAGRWGDAFCNIASAATARWPVIAVGNLLLAGLSECSAIRWQRWTRPARCSGRGPGAADVPDRAGHRGRRRRPGQRPADGPP